MKKILFAGIILVSMLGGAAYPVANGLNVPGDLTVTGTTGATGKIYAPSGVNAVGGTVEADHFIGDGSGILNITVTFAATSGTAEHASDLILTSQATGDLIYFDGSNWTRLAAGPVGYNLRSSGPGAAPAWVTRPWLRNGTTIEPSYAGDDFDLGNSTTYLDSDTRIYFDNSKSQYLKWSSGLSKFQFTDGVSADSFTGSGSGLTGLNASNISNGTLATTRGGLGSDISGSTQGDILYYNGTNWVKLPAGTSGNHLMTKGTTEAPEWSPAPSGTVTIIDTKGSLTGGPVTGIGTLDVANGGITEAKLQTGSVTSGAIANGTITEIDLGSRIVTSGAIALNTIAAENLAYGSVTSGAIANGTITAEDMATNSITQAAIAAGVPGANTYLKWTGSGLTWSTPAGGSGSVEVDEVTIRFNDPYGSLEVMDLGITAAKIANGTITAEKMGTNSVTAGALADDAVDTNAIQDRAVTGINIAVGTITAENMATKSVTQAAIATIGGAPSTNYFLRWNGSALDWASPAALTGSLEVDNITIDRTNDSSLEVRAGGISESRLAAGSVTSGAIADNTITGSDINTTTVITAAAFNGTVSSAGYAVSAGTATNADYATTAGSVSTAAYATLSGTASFAKDLNITGETKGGILYFNGTNWVTLEPGTSGYYLLTQGTGANPIWGSRPWRRIGTTIETVNISDDIALGTDTKIYLDTSRTQYLTWNSGISKFLFTNGVSADSFTGSGSGLTGLDASNISGGTLATTRGGLGADISGAAQGSILYYNGSSWAILSYGTSGYHLTTKGAGNNPSWEAGVGVTSVNSGRGLTGGPITTTGTLTIDTNVVVTTNDAQTLTFKTINASTIDGTSTINTTGVATFAAQGIGLYVSNTAEVGGSLVIGATAFDAANPERLKVDAGVTTSFNVISGYGSINNYLQLNIKNRSAGNSASGDLVVTADNGNETTNYVDVGINSSTYNDGSFSIGGINDAYLYNNGQNLTIGTQTLGKVIKFHTGGTQSQNERMRIDGSGNVGIGTAEPTATLEVYGKVKIGAAAPDPGANGLGVAGNMKVTGVVTAAAFDGVYWGLETKGASFVYPFATAEAEIRLPFNATIVSVEVHFDGGTTVVGQVLDGVTSIATVTGVSGGWGGSIVNYSYNAYNTLKFRTITVTYTAGNAVTDAAVIIHYRRR